MGSNPFPWPFWLRRRIASSGALKILRGRTQWIRRIVSDGTPASESRKYIVLWNGAANAAANLAGGNFLVGLYTILNVGDVLLGMLTTLVQLCNIFQILSPMLLNNFKRKKTILLVTRILYYFLYFIVLGLIPLIPGDDGLRIGLLLAAMVTANLINALAAPGYSVLHIRSIPKESRADFFSVLSLINYVSIYVFILVGGYVVDFFRDRGNFYAGIFAVRVFAAIIAAFEIYCHCHVHEYDEPAEDRRQRMNIFLPLKNKQFLICAVLTGLYNFFANIPGMYYNAYLINDVEAPYSFLGKVYFLSVPCMLIFVPVWNHVIQKKSWFGTISAALFLLPFHYFALPFVGSGNFAVLYTVAMVYYFAILPGVTIVTGNLPYYRLPEGNRTLFISFYAGLNSMMAMLGLFAGSLFIAVTESLRVNLFGWELGNKQLIMAITGFLLMALSFIYRFNAKKEQL